MNKAAHMDDPAYPALGLYVHWPYCARICPYCDFNVYKNRTINSDEWIAAFKQELIHAKTNLLKLGDDRRPLTSIYFGGGTPSLAPPGVFAAVIEMAEDYYGCEQRVEITIEANPADLTADQVRELRDLGINRMSLGVQSFDDGRLQRLGRDHTGLEARTAIDLAQSIFGNVTFDLIYGVPGQTLADWEIELGQAMQTGVDHLSFYQLTIEAGTAFARQVETGRLTMADDDDLARYYERVHEVSADAGFDPYEISNFARHGQYARHNLLYWRYQDYIGIGPGAHGRLTSPEGGAGGQKLATETILRPDAYLNACSDPSREHGLSVVHSLSAEEMLDERLSMGLRLKRGIALTPDDYFFTDEKRIQSLNTLIDDELLIYDQHTLRATDRGRQLLNWVVLHLLS